jgi:hypothetical protein
MHRLGFVLVLAACGHPHGASSGDAAAGGNDDALMLSDASHVIDAAHDGGARDAAIDGVRPPDAAIDAASTGIISGGPCRSGAPGAAAYRVHFANASGTAYVVYDVDGLPDHSRDHAGAYGYQIGFTPSFVDPFLGDGGLELGSDDFVDLELTTVGVSQITSATLAIYGRSYDVTTNGSFNWQTFVGYGEAPTDLVSNVPPYAWYAADMTTEIAPSDASTLIRIKAGPSSGVLVVNQIELCLQAS